MATEPLRLRVDIGVEPDADAGELDDATVQLRRELLALDVEDVERPTGDPPPPGTRAVDAAAIGTLIVTVGPPIISAVIRAAQGWLGRGSNRTVKIEIGDDSIELGDVSTEDQQRLIDAFIARHAAGSS